MDMKLMRLQSNFLSLLKMYSLSLTNIRKFPLVKTFSKVDCLKWFATVVTLAGAICTSFRFDPLNIYMLNAGALLFLIWSICVKDKALIVVNAGLLLIYILGIFL